MTNELMTTEHINALSPANLRTRVNAIQHAMKAVMREGTHYGKVPGTDKHSLFKAGSEVLLTMFGIAVDPEVEEFTDGDHLRYRVRCKGVHTASGTTVGIGVGEASTAEERYAWRRAVCDEEYEATSPERRRLKFSVWNQRVSTTKQVRTNVADLANTVLKMAKKRAQLDMTLTATAASDIFTQDVEDMDPAIVGGVDSGGEDRQTTRQPPKPPTARGSARPTTGGDTTPPDTTPATKGQVAFLSKVANGEDGRPTLAAALEACGIASVEGLTIAQWKTLKAWVGSYKPPRADADV